MPSGFGKDVSRIDVSVTGDNGWPEQTKGVVASSPGRCFVGLPFVYSFAAMLIGGVGRDADHIAANDQVKQAEPVAGVAELMVAGERGVRRSAKHVARGTVPLAAASWQILVTCCEALGVAPPGVLAV